MAQQLTKLEELKIVGGPDTVGPLCNLRLCRSCMFPSSLTSLILHYKDVGYAPDFYTTRELNNFLSLAKSVGFTKVITT
jgi:hypothetical protein